MVGVTVSGLVVVLERRLAAWKDYVMDKMSAVSMELHTAHSKAELLD